MRILLSLAFLISSVAFAGNEVPKTVKPELIARILAQRCETTSFKMWAAVAQKENFFKNDLDIIPVKLEGSTVTAKDFDLSVTIETGKFSAKSGAQTYAAGDACELILKINEGGKKSASLFSLALPEAFAGDIFKARRFAAASQVAAGGVAVVVGGVGAFLTSETVVGAYAFGALALGGAGVALDGVDKYKDLTAFENLLNADDLVISCTSTTLSLYGRGFKIEAQKHWNSNTANLDSVSGELTEKGRHRFSTKNFKTHSNLGEWIHELGKSCNDSNDASSVVSSIKAKRAATNDLVASIQGVGGSAPTSVLPGRAE
jgi:hypothetical protein